MVFGTGDEENLVASVREIEEFLTSIRSNMAISGRFHLVERKKNLASMAELGFTPDTAKQVILQLTYRDYDRGPLCDHRGDGFVWEFIKDVDGTKIYIKLKIDEKRGCVCLGFHKSVGPCSLPYRYRPSPGGI